MVQEQGGIPKEQLHNPSDFLERVVQTDIGSEYAEQVGADIDRTHAVAYRNEGEVQGLMWEIRSHEKEFIALHPPQGSWVTGKKRKVFCGDSRKPLEDKHLMEIDKITRVGESLATLGRNGKLLEEMGKTTQVSVQEINDQRGEEDDSGGLSSLF